MIDSLMTVCELARRSGVTLDTVRYYARIGLLQPKRHLENDYKLFANADVSRVRFIRRAKSLGYTLAEIKQILEHSMYGHSPCPLVRKIIQRRIKENRRKLKEMNALQQRMETALKQWQHMPDGEPDGDSVCHLIESFTDENP